VVITIKITQKNLLQPLQQKHLQQVKKL
jgi:hypothetical protein